MSEPSTVTLGERSNSKVDSLADNSMRGDNQSPIVKVTVDAGKHVNAVAICAALCAGTLFASLWALKEAYDAGTEARLTQYYLMDPHSRTPDELAAWAKFNREYERGK